MEYIQSEQNQQLKRCKALQQKKYRQQYGEFLAEGVRFVEEAIQQQADIRAVLIDERETELLARWNNLDGCSVYSVKEGLLDKYLSTQHPQGIAAIVAQPQWDWNRLGEMEQIVLIDGVQDPGNLGTIIRTAWASGTEAVICLKGTVDCFNDKTLRSTMGAIFCEPIYQAEDADDLVKQLHALGYTIMVSDIRAEQLYQNMTIPKKVALVVSNEANGPQLIREGDAMVKIPLYQNAESLNVAVATGILLYALKIGRE